MSTQVTSNPSPPGPQPRSLASPPPVPMLDTEALRRKLAGLADPLSRGADSVGEKELVKRTAARLCSILARHYNVSDDRAALWEHIGKAIATSLDKADGDDLAGFLCLCLESVMAEDGPVSRCPAVAAILADFDSWGTKGELRHAFLSYLRTHRYAVVVNGKKRWEDYKAKEIEL